MHTEMHATPRRETTRVRMQVLRPGEDDRSVSVVLPFQDICASTEIRLTIGVSPLTEDDSRQRRLQTLADRWRRGNVTNDDVTRLAGAPALRGKSLNEQPSPAGGCSMVDHVTSTIEERLGMRRTMERADRSPRHQEATGPPRGTACASPLDADGQPLSDRDGDVPAPESDPAE